MLLKLDYYWNRNCVWWSASVKRIRHFLSDDGPAGDCFWWLDVMLLLGGIRSTLTTDWVHQRKIRFVCWFLFAYHAFVFVLQLVDALNEENDASSIVLELVKVAFITVSFLKVLSAALLKQPIETLRQFIASNRITSDNADYDTLEQTNFNRIARRTMQVIFGLIVLDTILMSIPSSNKNELFKLPNQLTSTQNISPDILRVLLVNLLAISVVPEYFASTATVGITLLGMRAKLRILASRFGNLSQKSVLNVEQYYEQVNREVHEAVALHTDYWSHLQILKHLMARTFSLVHCFSIFAIGALTYVCHEKKMNLVTVLIAAGTLSFLLEYFLLCYLVDSLQDEADTIGHHIFKLCAQIPFSPKHRSEYVKLRTSLIIVWINTRNGIAMSCMGMIKISTSTFGGVLDVAYSVLKFLINIG